MIAEPVVARKLKLRHELNTGAPTPTLSEAVMRQRCVYGEVIHI